MNILLTSCIFIVAMAPIFCGDRETEPFVYSFEEQRNLYLEKHDHIAQNGDIKHYRPEYKAEPEVQPYYDYSYDYDSARPYYYGYRSGPIWSLNLEYQNAQIRCIESEWLTLENNLIFFNQRRNGLLFVSGGVSLCENEYLGALAGIGFRKFYGSFGLGSNIYFDYLHRSTDLFRVSWGGEIFSRIADLSCNIYIPVGRHTFDRNDEFYGNYIGDYEVFCEERRHLAKEFDVTFSRSYHMGGRSVLGLFIGAGGLDFYSHKKILYFQGGAKFDFSNLFSLEPKFFVSRGKVYWGLDVELNLFALMRGEPMFQVNRNNMMRTYHQCKYTTNY